MATKIQLRGGLAANWTSTNPVLAERELGIETDTLQFKFGNGVDAWTDLDYVNTGGGGGTWGTITGTITDQTDLVAALAATLASAQSYADGLVAGLLDLRGGYDASVNAWPSSGGSGSGGARLKGDAWFITVGGTLPTGVIVTPGDLIFAKIDTPGNTGSNWEAIQNNLTYVPEDAANKNASGGYVGLSGFSIMMVNAANTFTSLLRNTNTAIRTYDLMDRDGIIADTQYVDDGDNFTASQASDYAEGLISNVPDKRVMDVARTTALPSYTVTPGSGSTRTLLEATANGYFPTTDGILNDASNTIESFLATGETAGNAKYNGSFILIDKGSPSTHWKAQRTLDSQGPLALLPVDLAEVRIKRGTVNAGKTFRQVGINVVVDTNDQNWQDYTPATGGGTPASASDLNTGTDNTKFASALGLEGSKYLNQSGSKLYAVASGTNTYTASLTPAIASLTAGLLVNILFTNANTGPSTLNPNSLGAIALKKNGNQALDAGDIPAGALLTCLYDGTNFQVCGILQTSNSNVGGLLYLYRNYI